MEPDPEQMKAAVAAMRAEWRTLGPRVQRPEDPGLDEEERRAGVKQRAELFREFLQRHEAVLHGPDSPWAQLDVEALKRGEARMLEAEAQVEAREEELLHLTADLAECDTELNDALLRMLAGMEALTPEEWAMMEEGQRGKVLDALLRLREERPKLLATLPAERRRFWEKE